MIVDDIDESTFGRGCFLVACKRAIEGVEEDVQDDEDGGDVEIYRSVIDKTNDWNK